MSPTELPGINSDEFSRCEERGQITSLGRSLSKTQQNDAVIKDAIYHALWKDNVLRAIEYYEIDVHVRNETVYLYGHIVGATSQLRIMNALRTVPGVLGIKNHLVLDDKLTFEVATALGRLEHIYDCKFFTGTSHGVVSINGTVSDQGVKMLAEKCASSNPNVRCVVNNLHVLGAEPEEQDQPFLLPTIGEIIYFLDGISGVVRQVIINPNNRRVSAMTILGNFNKPQNALLSPVDGKAMHHEQLIVVPMKTVRYLTKASGFLYISSNERSQYQDFVPAYFYAPNRDWTPPYPYCLDDVLFSVEYRTADTQIAYGPHQFPFEQVLNVPSFKEQLFENDSLGG